MSPKLKDWIGLLARLILGAVLVYAGATKVGHPQVSARAVQAYQIFPFEVARYIGYALPFLEIVIGVLLVIGLFTRLSAVVATLLMAAFVVGIASAWARGLSIDCGCFGGGGAVDESQTAYPMEIARDLALTLLGLWLVRRPRSVLAVDSLLADQGAI